MIIASCWLHIQATNTADLADLVRQNRMAYGNLGPINAENLVRELQAVHHLWLIEKVVARILTLHSNTGSSSC